MKHLIWVLSLFALLHFTSCDVAEPDPVYNKNSEKQCFGILYSANLDTVNAYHTTSTIEFRLDSTNIDIKQVLIYIDSLMPVTAILNNLTFTFIVYPQALSDGLHTGVISIVDKNMGLFTANNIGALYFQFHFTTYSNWPSRASIKKIDAFKYPMITWKPCKDGGFKYYKVVRVFGAVTNPISTANSSVVYSNKGSTCPKTESKILGYQITNPCKQIKYCYATLNTLHLYTLEETSFSAIDKYRQKI
ncbi:MAG: hypothetical protein HYV28_21155 [Ignavibacteriales bacterium]|nr:hypothetical protein [Ignavibacteriales bacterium]